MNIYSNRIFRKNIDTFNCVWIKIGTSNCNNVCINIDINNCVNISIKILVEWVFIKNITKRNFYKKTLQK